MTINTQLLEQVMLDGWQPSVQWTHNGSIMSADTLTEASVQDVAIDLLGITYDDARTLFYGGNSRDMLRLMVKDLVNGEHLRLPYEYGSSQDEVPF